MNTITDIQEYLRLEREKRNATEGMTTKEFAANLGIGERAAQYWVADEVRAGRLKLNGHRKVPKADGHIGYAPVYTLVPHEAAQA